MHVIHLISDEPRPSDMLLAWALDSLPVAEVGRLWTLGRPELAERVVGVGNAAVNGHFPAGPGLGRTLAAAWRLGRALRRERPDVIHAWSARAAAVAGWACPGVPILVTTPHAPEPAAGASLWMPMGWRRGASVAWLGPHPPARQQLDAWRLGEATALRVQPAVDVRRFADAEPRARRRMSWGVTDDHARIVVTLSDQPERIEAMSAILGVGLAWEAGRNVRLLISPRTGHLARAQRVLRDASRQDRVIVDPLAEQPWRIAGAVDAALVLGDGMSLAWATAAGLPAIVPREGQVLGRRAGEGRSEAVYARPDSTAPGRIAPHVCRLHDHFAEARRQAVELRGRARDQHDLGAWRQGLAGVYGALADRQPVSWIDVGSRASATG